jgi:predicted phosphoribosyltransferase
MMHLAEYRDRREAGVKLAEALAVYSQKKNTIVLALPRGGVPVAKEIATRLNLPLDLMLVRKLGVPGYVEIAVGAIADGPVVFLDQAYIDQMALSPETVNALIARETAELARRNALYRQGRPPPDIEGKTVLLVDDGVATGADMRAAARAVRARKAAKIIIAVPVAPAASLEALEEEADVVVCPMVPDLFFAVAQAYENFAQVRDAEVLAILGESEARDIWQGSSSEDS